MHLSPCSCPAAREAANPLGILVPFLRCRPLARPFSSSPFLQASPHGFSSLLGHVDVCEHRYPSLPTAASICVLRGFCHLSVPGATRIPATFFALLRTVLPIDAIANSVLRACAVRADVVPSSLPSACMTPKTFPPVLSLRRKAESRACASSFSVVRCKLKKIRAGSRMVCPAPVKTRIGYLPSASNLRSLANPICPQTVLSMRMPLISEAAMCGAGSTGLVSLVEALLE